MSMKPSLQVRLSQHLALTPQLQQSIRLLQLSTLELQQEVEQMLEQNPFLETDDDSRAVHDTAADRERDRAAAGEGGTEAAADAGGDGYDGEEVGEVNAGEFGTTEREDWENGTEADDFDGIRELPSASGEGAAGADPDAEGAGDQRMVPTTLQEHLREQTVGMRLSPEDRLALHALIESLDVDGYLADPLEEIAVDA